MSVSWIFSWAMSPGWGNCEGVRTLPSKTAGAVLLSIQDSVLFAINIAVVTASDSGLRSVGDCTPYSTWRNER